MASAVDPSGAPKTKLYRSNPGERWWFALLLIPTTLTALVVYTRGASIESDLRADTLSALTAAGLPATKVEMHGRKATLLVPTGESQAKAVATARTVEGIGDVSAEHVARNSAEARACRHLQTKIDDTTHGRGVSFAGSSLSMTAPGAEGARAIAKLLVRCPFPRVVAEGHVDGSVLKGSTVSLRRAEVVREALVRGGVSRARIATKGYGDTFPLSTSDPSLNNRVAITLEVD
jgi:outer membrane protein OmpA-like peptidoglycan-associated protein